MVLLGFSVYMYMLAMLFYIAVSMWQCGFALRTGYCIVLRFFLPMRRAPYLTVRTLAMHGWERCIVISLLAQVFTALHCMQRGLSDERLSVCSSVCLSVCLSVKRVNCDKTKAPSEKSSIMTNRPRAFQ